MEDADATVSNLAFWVKASDADASIRIVEGFGAALAKSASLRLDGSTATQIALSLTEHAASLSAARDARHVGWLLLSLKLELLDLRLLDALGTRQSRDDLLRQLDILEANLIEKGVTAIIAGESRCRCDG